MWIWEHFLSLFLSWVSITRQSLDCQPRSHRSLDDHSQTADYLTPSSFKKLVFTQYPNWDDDVTQSQDYWGQPNCFDQGQLSKYGIRYNSCLFFSVMSLSLDGSLTESPSTWKQRAWKSESGSRPPDSKRFNKLSIYPVLQLRWDLTEGRDLCGEPERFHQTIVFECLQHFGFKINVNKYTSGAKKKFPLLSTKLMKQEYHLFLKT